jgi:hypothetical protein
MERKQRLLRGVAGITRHLYDTDDQRMQRAVLYAIERGHIKSVFKIGHVWHSRPEELDAELSAQGQAA